MKTKPRSFFGFFFRRWAVSLVISAVVALIAIFVYKEFFVMIRELEENTRISDTVSTINMLDGDISVHTYNRVHSDMCFLVYGGKAEQWGVDTALVLEDKNGSIIATSERWAFATYYDKEAGIMTTYECGDDSLVALAEKYSEAEFIVIEPDEIYVRDGIFFAGNVTIKCYESGEVVYTETTDLTPDDITGYTCISERIDCYVSGTASDSEVLKWLTETVSMGDTDEFHELNEYLPNGAVRYASQYQLKIGGEYYTLYALRKIDFFGANGRGVALFCVVMLAVSMIGAGIAAMISYSRYRINFINEQYRRNITDTMAHDLKSPLAAISGYAENLKDNIQTEKREHYAAAILDNVEYMNGIISNVLELSRYESGRVVLKREQFDAVALSKELFGKYELMCGERNILGEISGECEIFADKQLMERLLDNLWSNAVKYSEAGTVIKLHGDKKSIRMENISSKEVVFSSNLADPFIKGDPARSGKTGSGLGLVIARNIADLHGYLLELFYEDGRFIVKISL